MAVPKRKTSKSKRNMRRSHDGIQKINIAYDSVTGEPKLPHHLSLTDGYYNGKKIVKTKAPKEEKSGDMTEAAAKES
ncbi:50S ribosomal protein L32 [Candidatus Bandiella euplotis]|uniref:Large ribosomal subunit protein bL32 n=1 Tax=Candidatus Bandiella euplotis TaxID=1664265 RepID=A0ABZ0ULY2_9RICK|nr:50S ribosomal protein L32 [Candidatus Bandiella woodruffii]WPX96739.1 50S ribosomal protein L32 [Candidatus Bandiella woodruffii]